MGKDKLRKFAELSNFERVFQPVMDEITNREYYLKGSWVKKVFQNNNPLTLELGCGKGEYTVGLAKNFPDRNFIGVDIKGARIWKGAKFSHEQKILNAAFLRTRIELISSFFDRDEVDEIWITFPDPQPTERRKKKRLTGSIFLNLYQNLLVDGGIIHLKTDSILLYNYTLQLLKSNNINILYQSGDLYNDKEFLDPILEIKTYYEQKFLDTGCKINYLKFRLFKTDQINEIAEII